MQIESKFLKAIEKISPNAVKSAQERIDLHLQKFAMFFFSNRLEFKSKSNHIKERFLSRIEKIATEMIEEEKLISDAGVKAEILHSDDENDITHFESFKN